MGGARWFLWRIRHKIWSMTASLKQAFASASHLPQAMQDELAKQVLEDIEGELKWDKTLADSQDLLEKMAQKARSAKRQGKTVRKGFDEL
jgi:hypothetical protein